MRLIYVHNATPVTLFCTSECVIQFKNCVYTVNIVINREFRHQNHRNIGSRAQKHWSQDA